MAGASKLGPGRLIFGETGTPSNWGGKVTKIEVKPDSKPGDKVTFLDWSEQAGDTEDSWTIAGELAQTWDADSLVKWTWDNHLETVPVTFIPDAKGALKLTGKVQIVRIGFGGDVKKTNYSSFEFTGVGDPVLTSDNTPDD